MRCFLTAVSRPLGRFSSRFPQETARLTAVPHFWSDGASFGLRFFVTGTARFCKARASVSLLCILKSAVPHFRSDGAGKPRAFFSTFLFLPFAFLFLIACAPSKDTVLSDVERNYTGAGFLDTDTFQITCPLPASSEDRLGICRQKLITELVQYKERYDREAFARRMHQDFLPFFKPADVTDAEREEWRRNYHVMAEGRTRLVFERSTGDGFEGVYRLRLKDLIYRVQKAK